MFVDPLDLNSVGLECVGRGAVYSEGFLEGLAKLKEKYEKINYPEKSVREVANHSSILLDLQTYGNSYIGIKDLLGRQTRQVIRRGIRALKKEGKECNGGHYEYRNNIFLIFKKDFAARENLFIQVSD